MSSSIGGVPSVGKIKHTQSVGFSAVIVFFMISYIVCCRIPETALNVAGVSPQPVSK